LNQSVKPQDQTSSLKRRCTFRANRLSWCKKLKRVCDAPSEYNSCSSYQPKPPKPTVKPPAPQQSQNENDDATNSPHTLLIGVKTGQCDICKVTKKTLLLRFGFCLCEDCLTVCTSILEQIQFDDFSKPPEKILVGRGNNRSFLNKTQNRRHHATNF
jgi:hypothetical protein